MVPFESLCTVSYSPSILTLALSFISSEINTDIGRKLWFFTPPLHSASPLGGGIPSEYCHPVWCGKTRMAGLPDGEKNLRICITVHTQYRRVTDRQTYISSRHSRYAYASCGINGLKIVRTTKIDTRQSIWRCPWTPRKMTENTHILSHEKFPYFLFFSLPRTVYRMRRASCV